MYPSGNANADLGYNKHAHAHGLGHGHSQNQFLTQPPPPPPHFALPTGGQLNPLVAPSLPLAMQGGTGIDWAQLAQQWIHMRDAGVVMPPVAPPPPIIGNVPEFHHQAIALPLPIIVQAPHPHLEEHGEADMDMDEEADRGNGAETPPPPAPVVTQSQWLAASEASASDPAVLPTNLGPSGVGKRWEWRFPALHFQIPSSSAGFMHGKQPWNNWQPGKLASPTAHIPSLLKLNVSNPNEPQQQLQMKMQLQPPQQQPLPHQQQQQQQNHQPESDASGSNEIDANKRKMLPAWIRSGKDKKVYLRLFLLMDDLRYNLLIFIVIFNYNKFFNISGRAWRKWSAKSSGNWSANSSPRPRPPQQMSMASMLSKYQAKH